VRLDPLFIFFFCAKISGADGGYQMIAYECYEMMNCETPYEQEYSRTEENADPFPPLLYMLVGQYLSGSRMSSEVGGAWARVEEGKDITWLELSNRVDREMAVDTVGSSAYLGCRNGCG
jgi:hypothetical protein